MKRLVIILSLAGALIAMSACGSNSKPDPSGATSLTTGNWLLTATSSTLGNNSTRQYTMMRGALTSSNSTISAMMSVNSSVVPCYQAAPDAFTGTIGSDGLTLTSTSVDGSVMTITGSASTANSLSGTYTSSQGTSCTTEDSGVVYGLFVPSISSTNWGGTFTSSRYGLLNIDASITQLAPGSTGIFPLSGTVTVQGYPCFATGTIDSTNSFIQGETVTITADAADGSELELSAYLPNPATATEMDSGTQLLHIYGGSCSFDSGKNVTLTR